MCLLYSPSKVRNSCVFRLVWMVRVMLKEYSFYCGKYLG
ncbi:hypothetical protein AO366_1116 [Moraxella catarrhalis]|nr:hypothetical protein AO366_1116 [Moraxella catarrhalis]